MPEMTIEDVAKIVFYAFSALGWYLAISHMDKDKNR